MPIKVIIFSILLNGSSVKKEYYIGEKEIVAVEKYFDENEELLDQKILKHTAGEDIAVILESGKIHWKQLTSFEEDSWIRADKMYDLSLEFEKVSEFQIKKVKYIDEAIETTLFEKIDFDVFDIRLVNEIISYDSSYYLTLESETIFNDSCIFSLKLEGIRTNEEKDRLKYSQLLSDILKIERN